jgi:hypothetical protein
MRGGPFGIRTFMLRLRSRVACPERPSTPLRYAQDERKRRAQHERYLPAAQIFPAHPERSRVSGEVEG